MFRRLKRNVIATEDQIRIANEETLSKLSDIFRQELDYQIREIKVDRADDSATLDFNLFISRTIENQSWKSK